MHSNNQSKTPIAFFLPTLSWGGMEKMAVHLAVELAEQGFMVELVVMRDHGLERASLKVPDTISVAILNVNRGLTAVSALARYLASRKPSVLVAISTPLCVSAFASHLLSGRKVPCVCRQVSTFSRMFAAYKGYNRWLTPLVARQVLKRTRVIAISRGVADDLVQNAGVQRSRVRVLYNPTISRDFSIRLEEKVTIPWSTEFRGPLIVAVGRLVVAKGFDVLISALGMLRTTVDANLVILGEGPERTNLEAMIRLLGLEDAVSLAGYYGNVLPVLKQADVFAMTSRWEGFGNVLVEALYTGVPVVSTDCPNGPREILDGGRFGTLVPVDDPAAVADGIRRVLEGKVSIDNDALKEWLGQFTVENAAREFVGYLEEFVPEPLSRCAK